MPQNLVPDTLFPGYKKLNAADVAGIDGILIPLSALPGLSENEAASDGTGDGRKVAFEVIKAVIEKYTALPTDQRPLGMVATRTTPTGLSPTTIRQTLQLTFDLEIDKSDVSPAQMNVVS